ncbi:MAG: efflux RND transporter periplasmic adaptor subunit [Planctomycetes bacterium]|nr:efflux RND transporter periplasmic adaptor subunit [Planctomycetota bacterium]
MTTRKAIGVTMMAIALAAVTAVGASCSKRTSDSGAATGGDASARSSRQVPVSTVAARQMTFESRLVTSGSLLSKDYALVSARIPGTLDAVYVDEGDTVAAGETKLFQTDSVNLTRAVEIAWQGQAAAECSVREAEANRERVEADFNKARLDYERFKRLFEQDHAVTQSAFEAQQSRFLQAEAALKYAKVSVELAGKRLEQARGNAAIAEKDLRDSLVVAPLSGVVTRRLREPGEMAAAGTPVLKIENTHLLEVSAYLPSEAYASVVPGRTEMHVRVGQTDLGMHAVTYRSPTADLELRTFEAKCEVTDPPADAVPGRLADVAVVLVRREALGVPVASVQQRGGKHVVFIVDGKAARAVEVTTGLETDGWVEATGTTLAQGAAVIFRGQQLVNDGDTVNVIGEGD